MQRILIPTRGRLADAMFQPMEWGNGVGRVQFVSFSLESKILRVPNTVPDSLA